MSVTRGIPSRMLTSRGLDPCYICMTSTPQLIREEVIQVVNLVPLAPTLPNIISLASQAFTFAWIFAVD